MIKSEANTSLQRNEVSVAKDYKRQLMFAPGIWRTARQIHVSSGFFSRPSALLHSKESESNDKNTYEEDITNEDAVTSIGCLQSAWTVMNVLKALIQNCKMANATSILHLLFALKMKSQELLRKTQTCKT